MIFLWQIQGLPYLPFGIFPIWWNHREIPEMLTSLKIRWLKWQIQVLLKLKQFEDRKSRNGSHVSLG